MCYDDLYKHQPNDPISRIRNVQESDRYGEFAAILYAALPFFQALSYS